jgi:CBS domain containing-hemolysin-like protein
MLKNNSLLPHEESPVDTIGGLIMKEAGRVPDVGDEFTLPGNIMVKVLEADGRRIQRLSLHVPAMETK